LKKPVIIISLQNGVHNAEFAEEVCGFKIFSSVVLFNSVCQKEGFVLLTMKGRILLENAKGYEKVLLQIARALKKARINVKLVDDIHAACWSKLVLNLQIAITALTGQTIYESLTNRISRKIIIATLKEGLQIAKHSKLRLSTLPVVDPRWMIWMLQILGPFSPVLSSLFLKMKKNARNSLWQSLIQGKKTEIDYINGEIIHLARQQNLQAPINTKLVELVKEAEGKSPLKYITPNRLQKLLNIG